MPRRIFLLASLLAAAPFGDVHPAPAPPPAPSEAAKAMVGAWEFSNADRDKICTITFKADSIAIGMKLEFDSACGRLFPFIKEIAGWRRAENDFLRLLNAKGRSVLEFSEVESGMFEAPRPGQGILFIQAAAAAAPAPRTVEQISGEWAVVRGSGKAICALTLSVAAAGEGFALKRNPGCEPFVTRFNPVAWRLDRGELLLSSAGGDTWRFEEADPATWRRVPEAADPVLLVRKQ
jgi:hypothetical protein